MYHPPSFKSNERAQILIILALGLVGFLCVTALAVDLGQVYNDRRYDQNVADSAALAAGQAALENFKWLKPSGFNCDTGGAYVTSLSDPAWVTKPAWMDAARLEAIFTVAKTTAASNNKTDLVDGLATQNGVALACGMQSDGVTPFLDVKVMVSNNANTSFVQFFNGGPMRNTVQTVTRTIPRNAMLGGYAIYALDPSCQEGITLLGGGHANPNVEIDGGGAFSRSCIGSTGHASMTASTSISCLYNPSAPASWCNPNDANFNPRLSTINTDPLKGAIPVPDCTDRTIAPDRSASTGSTLQPGYYSGGLPGHANLQLLPGLYCISGSVKVNGGGSITSIPDPVTGIRGVTIVFMDGEYSQTGNGYMSIEAPSPDPTVKIAPNTVPGVAIIFPPSNSSPLKILGNSMTNITGTVYAPSSEIEVGGTAGVPISTQFIGLKFKYNGTETEHVVYNGDVVYQLPASLQLYK